MYKVPLEGRQPEWIGNHVWQCLQTYWVSESFKKRQAQAKTVRASEKGGSLNTYGLVSTATHVARMVIYKYFLIILIKILFNMYLLIELLHKIQEEHTDIPLSNAELFVATRKKKIF